MAKDIQTELGQRMLAKSSRIIADGSAIARIGGDPRRIGVIIGNTTASVIFANFTEVPAALGGLPIQALFGRLEMFGEYWGDALTGKINILCNAAADVVSVLELISAP